MIKYKLLYTKYKRVQRKENQVIVEVDQEEERL